MERISSFRETRPRYPALRTVGFLCSLGGRILMAIGLGLTLMAGLYMLAARGGPMAAPPPVIVGYSLLWALGILFSGLQLFAIGAFFRLLIHLEENTRASAQALDQIRSRLDRAPENPEAFFRP